MHYYTITFLIFVFGFLGVAQSQPTEFLSHPVQRPQSAINHTSARTQNFDDTLGLPFADDFSYHNSEIPNPRLWSDAKVFINKTLAIGMYSYGTATFDGLNEGGFPYLEGSLSSDTLADVLTSRYLDLSNRNNVVLTFYYQPKGLGEAPETNDSLVVDFWAPGLNQWRRVWSVRGEGDVKPFKAAAIEINQPEYLQKGFRFRIGNYGARGGAFDMWHIDYLRLNANRTLADTSVVDAAFINFHPNMLTGNFSHIPYWLFDNSRLKTTASMTYRKNGNPGSINLILGRYNVFYQGNLIAASGGSPSLDDTHPYNTEVVFDQSYTPPQGQPIVINPLPNQEFELNMYSYFTGANEGLRRNDTLWHTQSFRNFYAFDDGSAERAYGIENQAEIYTLFSLTPEQADTLKGLYINFTPAGVDATQNEFRIAIWLNNNNFPTQLLYESDSLYTPEYVHNWQKFGIYELDEPFYLNNPVFIGVKQRTAEKLNIGFDVNNPGKTQIIYGDGFNWFPSAFDGALLIRPYFRYAPLDLSTQSIDLQGHSFTFYPNPNKGILNFKTDLDDTRNLILELYDISGRKVMAEPLREYVDINILKSGMYVLLVKDQNNTMLYRQKISKI
jgi:hypothetical protein